MIDYKKFLKQNGLKQIDLARYLGVTKSSVSSAVSGRSNFSEENFEKIINNDRGWDCSMLGSIENRNRDVISALNAHIHFLDEQIKEKDSQIERLLAILEEKIKEL